MFNRKKGKDTRTYGIIGLGRFGRALALELCANGADLMVLDENEDKIRELREYTENAFIVKNLDRKTLSETGIQDCDVVIVCIAEHLDTSILTTLNLVSLGISTVIAKAQSIEHGEILEKLGAEVVYPERDMAIRLAHRLEASKALDFIQLSEKLNISKILAPEKSIGKTVLEVDLRGKFGVTIIAVENGKTIHGSIRPTYTFKPGDILYVCGSKEALNKLTDWQ